MGLVSSRAYHYADAAGQSQEEGIVTNWPVATLLLLSAFVAVFCFESQFKAPEENGLSPLTQILLGG